MEQSRYGDMKAADPRMTGHAKRGHALKAFGNRKLRVLVAADMLAHVVDVRRASPSWSTRRRPSMRRPTSTAAPAASAATGLLGPCTWCTVLSLPRSQEEMERLRGFADELGFENEVRDAPAPVARPRRYAAREKRVASRA